MNDRKFIKDYLDRYKKSLLETDVSDSMISMKKLLLQTRDNGKKAIIAGNGGSAAIASHVSIDLTKQAGIKTVNFNEASLITCFANDYGYENWIAYALNFYTNEGDLVILISSSGKSKNMINGAIEAKRKGVSVITFTGFEQKNPLSLYGDPAFWVDSSAYNVIENTHQIWLLLVADLVKGEIEYPA